MNFPPERLARLARTCGLAPRALLVAAARLTRTPGAGAVRIAGVLETARASSPAAQSAGALLATPSADFAKDDIDHALVLLWPPPP